MDLEKVKQHRNGDLEIVHELRDSGKPILIYGCANHAELVYLYLKEHGLEAEGFFVDAMYWKENCYIRDKKIESIEKYQERLEHYNIVIGFCDVEKSRMLLGNPLLLKSRFYLLWEPFTTYEWNEAYMENNWESLREVYADLADGLSKAILQELIVAKLNYDGRKLIELADSKQYFNELTYEVRPENEVYVDCGAFNGDTISKYAKFTNGSYHKMYAFEPNKQNARMLAENVGYLPRIEIIPKGTWKEETVLEFEENGSASQIVESGGKSKIEVTAIDEVVKGDKVTFIKMDVEGSEMESLKGAENTIRSNMPKLAICCYHKEDDIINLYQYIKSFHNDDTEYKFYLRHHSNSVYETVFYAIPVRRKGK